MKFDIVRVSTNSLIETVKKEDLTAVCDYVNKWYGEDNGDVDIYFFDNRKDNDYV